jgi:hypothetical protein
MQELKEKRGQKNLFCRTCCAADDVALTKKQSLVNTPVFLEDRKTRGKRTPIVVRRKNSTE